MSLAPTNKAANIINGITLHKFVSKIRNNKNMDKFHTDYIFVDEISMMKEQFYKFLIYIKAKKPDIKFILCGDYNQLSPVCDRINNVDYKNSMALYELSDGNRLELSKCRRSDDILFNMCKFENIMNVNKENFNNKQFNKCVSYLHSTRIKINDICMKQRLKAYHKTNKIKLEKNIFDPHSQDVILCTKMPIISKINNSNLIIKMK